MRRWICYLTMIRCSREATVHFVRAEAELRYGVELS
jgi:hypothetical protein